MTTFEWRGPFTNAEANALHADAFDHRPFDDDWHAQLDRHSVGWVTARADGDLVGFVNVVWDGLVHAFIQDTAVAGRAQRQGIGVGLIAVARDNARAAGCEMAARRLRRPPALVLLRRLRLQPDERRPDPAEGGVTPAASLVRSGSSSTAPTRKQIAPMKVCVLARAASCTSPVSGLM